MCIRDSPNIVSSKKKHTWVAVSAFDKAGILGRSFTRLCEEITRIKQGAVSTPKAVDSSPSRRLDIALRNLAIGCTSATAGSKRTLVQGIVSEITKAAEGDVAAYSIGKREEIERIAASAR